MMVITNINIFRSFLFLFAFFSIFSVSAQYSLPLVELESASPNRTVSLRVGRTLELAKIRFENSGRKNLLLESIVLRNYGSVDLDESLSDTIVTLSGKNIPVEVYPNKKDVRIVFPEGFEIWGGRSPVLRIQSTLAYARSNDTLQLGIRRQEDVRIRDVSSGFYVPVVFEEGIKFTNYDLTSGSLYAPRNSSVRYYGSRSSSPSALSSSLYSRNLYSSRNNTSVRLLETSRDQYAPGARDIVFLNRSVASARDFYVSGIFFPIDGSQSSEDLERAFGTFKLYIDDLYEEQTSRFEWVNGRLGILFDRDFDFMAGSHNIKVVGNVSRLAQNGDRIRFLYSKDSFLNVEYE